MTELNNQKLPACSVVLPVLNPPENFFVEAVDSILEQSLSGFELIIVEKKSSFDIFSVLGSRMSDPRLRYYCGSQWGGLVEQLNFGVSVARSEIIVRMDADDVALPNRLEVQVSELVRNSSLAVLGSAIVLIDEANAVIGRRFYPQATESVRLRIRRENPLAHPSVAFRKAAVIAAGGYQESGFPVEDYDLWSRVAKAGYEISNLPEPLLRYRVHRGASKSKKLKLMLRGTIFVKRKYWSSEFVFCDKVRLIVEALGLLVPSMLIWALFRVLHRK